MFVDYQKESYEHIKAYEMELRSQKYFELINFWNINDLWKEIQFHKGKKIFAVFNGKFIILEKEDNITEDELYIFITGKNKKENELENKRYIEKLNKDREEYNKKIPELTIKYTNQLKSIVESKYQDKIDEIVKVCLDTIYKEYLIESIIDLVKFSKDKSMEEIEQKIYSQGHSGNSYDITIHVFSLISDKGKDFLKYLRRNKKEIH